MKNNRDVIKICHILGIWFTWFAAAFVSSCVADAGHQPNELKSILSSLSTDKSYQALGLVGMFLIGISIIVNSLLIQFGGRNCATKIFSRFLAVASTSLAMTPFSLLAFVLGLIAYSHTQGEPGGENMAILFVVTAIAFVLLFFLPLFAIVADPDSGTSLSEKFYNTRPICRYGSGISFVLASLLMIWDMASTPPF